MEKVTKWKKTTKRETGLPPGWKPPPTPLQRAQNMVDSLLDAMEAELRSDRPPGERYEQLFGSKGLLANLPKLIQLLETMAEPAEAATAAAGETLSRDELRLLKEWLAQDAD